MLKVKDEYRNGPFPIYVQDPEIGDAYIQITARPGGVEARRHLDDFGMPYTDLILPITLNANEGIDDILGSVIIQSKFISTNEIDGVFSIPRIFLLANQNQNLGTLPSMISVEHPLFYDLKFHIDALMHDVMVYLFGETPTELFSVRDIILLPQSNMKLKDLIANTYRNRFETEEKFQLFKNKITVNSIINIDSLNISITILQEDLVPELIPGTHEYKINSNQSVWVDKNTLPFAGQNPFIHDKLLEIYTE